MEEDDPSVVPSVAGPSAQMFRNAHHVDLQTTELNNVQGVNIHQTFPFPIVSPQPRGQSAQVMVASAHSHQTPVYSESGNYTTQLLHRGRGFPLYVPGPQIGLQQEYRMNGVAIGDVGTVTTDGHFDFYFNIYLEANNPINADVPEGFIPLSPYKSKDVVHRNFNPGSYVSAPSVIETRGDSSEFPGGQFVFTCRGPNGAVLALPHGAHQAKLTSLKTMRQYAVKHAQSWYKYVNDTRERELVNGSLYLITGWEKAKSWGMASFHDVSLRNEFHISFTPTTDAVNGHRYRWHAAYCRVHEHFDPPLVEGTPLNQTTFIHAFKISLGQGIWGRLFGNVEVRQLVDPSNFPDKGGGGYVPYGSQGSSFAWSFFSGSSGTSGGKQYSYTGRALARENGIISDASPVPQVHGGQNDSQPINPTPCLKVFHPSQIIHERILREAPQATVVITHDDDWCDIFRDNGMQLTEQNSSVLQQAIFDRSEVIVEEGAAFLRAKSDPTRSNAHPVTLKLRDKPTSAPLNNRIGGSFFNNASYLNFNGREFYNVQRDMYQYSDNTAVAMSGSYNRGMNGTRGSASNTGRGGGTQYPTNPQYQMPPNPQYQAPPNPQYPGPPTSQYQAPPNPQYQAPPNPQYQPPNPQFQSYPQAPNLGRSYTQPAANLHGTNNQNTGRGRLANAPAPNADAELSAHIRRLTVAGNQPSASRLQPSYSDPLPAREYPRDGRGPPWGPAQPPPRSRGIPIPRRNNSRQTGQYSDDESPEEADPSSWLGSRPSSMSQFPRGPANLPAWPAQTPPMPMNQFPPAPNSSYRGGPPPSRPRGHESRRGAAPGGRGSSSSSDSEDTDTPSAHSPRTSRTSSHMQSPQISSSRSAQPTLTPARPHVHRSSRRNDRRSQSSSDSDGTAISSATRQTSRRSSSAWSPPQILPSQPQISTNQYPPASTFPQSTQPPPTMNQYSPPAGTSSGSHGHRNRRRDDPSRSSRSGPGFEDETSSSASSRRSTSSRTG